MNQNQEVKSYAFLFQVTIFFVGVFYIGYIILSDTYFSTTPAALVTTSLGVAIIYLCIVGLNKLQHEKIIAAGYIPKRNTLNNFKMLYLIVIFVTILLGLILPFRFKSLDTPLADSLAVLTLILTLCVDMLTNFFTKLICKKMIKA